MQRSCNSVIRLLLFYVLETRWGGGYKPPLNFRKIEENAMKQDKPLKTKEKNTVNLNITYIFVRF